MENDNKRFMKNSCLKLTKVSQHTGRKALHVLMSDVS